MSLATPLHAGSLPVPGAPQRGQGALPPALAAQLWRGDQFCTDSAPVLPSGFDALDAELPGGGWPCRALVELLQPQPSVVEWRLLGPALARVTSRGGTVVLVGPPKPPHPPGLAHAGIDGRRLVWVCAETPAERLWCAEQLAGAAGCGAVVAWLPQARPVQMRRLQIAAQRCEGPLFACRPEAARHEASAAPLRLHAACGEGWQLRVRVLKRRGPAHDGVLGLPSVPGGLGTVLVPGGRAAVAPLGPSPASFAPSCAASPAGADVDVLGRAAARSAAAH